MTAYPRTSKKFVRRVKGSSLLPRLKIFIYVLIAVSVILIFFWGEFGFFRMWILHRKIVKLENEVLTLKVAKQDLLWEIDKMKHDPDYLIKHAVENFGYARPDQKIIQFVPVDTSMADPENMSSE